MIKWIKSFFPTKPKYIITQEVSGVTYYHMGEGNKWTPLFEGAKIYEERPNYLMVEGTDYKIEEV